MINVVTLLKLHLTYFVFSSQHMTWGKRANDPRNSSIDLIHYNSDRSGTRNPGFRSALEKWVEEGFSSFFDNFFWHIWWFFKVKHVLRHWNFEKLSNMPKIWQKMKKSVVWLALNPFFGWFLVPENLISGTCSVTYNPVLDLVSILGIIFHLVKCTKATYRLILVWINFF